MNFHFSSKKPASTFLPGDLSSGGTVVSTMDQLSHCSHFSSTPRPLSLCQSPPIPLPSHHHASPHPATPAPSRQRRMLGVAHSMQIFIALIIAGILSASAADGTPSHKTETQDSSGLDDPLAEALARENYSLAKRLLANGHPVRGRASTPHAPAYWAIATNNVKGLRLLVHFVLNVNYDWGMIGGNLLTNAVQLGHLEQVRLLCEAGASVKRNPRFGRSPLYASVIYDHPDIERYLRTRGAQYNQWDIEAFKTLGMKPR